MEHLAYIDPTSGSLFIQAIIGSVLAVGVALRKYVKPVFYKIKLALSRQTIVDGKD